MLFLGVGLFLNITTVKVQGASTNLTLAGNKKINYSVSSRADSKINSEFSNISKANAFKNSIAREIKDTYSKMNSSSMLPGFSDNIDLKEIRIVTNDEMSKQCGDSFGCYYIGEGMVLYNVVNFETGGSGSPETVAHELVHASTNFKVFPKGNLNEGFTDFLACEVTNCDPTDGLGYPDEYLVVDGIKEAKNLQDADLFKMLKTGGTKQLDALISPVKSEQLNTLLKNGSASKVNQAFALVDSLKNSNSQTTTNNTSTSTSTSSTSTSNNTAASSLYCAEDILALDQAQIDFISNNYSTNIKKSDKAIVLIQNDLNDFSTTYSVEVLKQDKQVSIKTGELGGTISSNNITNYEISTSNLDLANYVIKAKLYHKDKHCLLQLKTFNITITNVEDISAPNGVQLFDQGEVVIGALDKTIKAGEMLRITIQNKFTADFQFEIYADNLETKDFVRKNKGTVKAGMDTSTWANITSVGDHTVRVDILNATGDKLLYSQPLKVKVTAATTNPAGNTGTSSGTDGTKTNDTGANNQPITNSDEAGINPTLGAIFKAIFPSGGGADANLSSIGKLILKVTDYALNFAGIVAFIMVLWAGRMFLNAYGSDETAAMGKKTLTWALVGLVVILISKGLLLWVVEKWLIIAK